MRERSRSSPEADISTWGSYPSTSTWEKAEQGDGRRGGRCSTNGVVSFRARGVGLGDGGIHGVVSEQEGWH